MTRIALPALALAMAPFFSAPAAAWEGHVQECYETVYVAPEYKYSKRLIKRAETVLEYRGKGKNRQVVRVHYPAVYEEIRNLAQPGHYVLRPAKCRN
ncbi:MAG: hypothetical protein HLUCCA05_05470 [Roseibaca calidilacus]|uniref:Uncharacterized protein n=1 Tax=Roseibaca calidilacus TaxID=1666912 RepID=A0A0P8A9L8_9RHOB|nr:hypothetical protein [Roseibaca calidilacus]KPP90864.1 MAG: hypothetical protein HLUCCA05_05470 [Roseibaca calidilacus]CUX83699.1 hypothetical protein Ga0058931_3134 [Roseibaca calidilacus]